MLLILYLHPKQELIRLPCFNYITHWDEIISYTGKLGWSLWSSCYFSQKSSCLLWKGFCYLIFLVFYHCILWTNGAIRTPPSVGGLQIKHREAELYKTIYLIHCGRSSLRAFSGGKSSTATGISYASCLLRNFGLAKSAQAEAQAEKIKSAHSTHVHPPHSQSLFWNRNLLVWRGPASLLNSAEPLQI